MASAPSIRPALLGVTLALSGLTACQSGPPRYMPTAEYDTPAEPGALYRWTFDPPPTRGTGIVASRPTQTFLPTYGKWEIAQDATAPTPPNVYLPKADARSGRETGYENAAKVVVVGVAFTDFAARVRVKIPHVRGTDRIDLVGLVVDARDGREGVVALVESDAHKEALRIAPSRQIFDRAVGPSQDHEIPEGESHWRVISIELRGTNLTAQLDGAPAIELDDVIHDPARIGLVTIAGDGVAFDDLEAREIPRGEASPTHAHVP